MTIRIFDIENAGSQEANDVRNLLSKNNIKYYETPESNWGGGLAAIWVVDNDSARKAIRIIAKYQNKKYGSKNIHRTKLKIPGFFLSSIVILLVVGVWFLVK